MKIKRFLTLGLIVFVSLSFTGCLGVNGEFRTVRNHVLSNIEMDVNRDIEISIGPALISFASLFVKFAETEEPVDEMLRQISRVQVGVYKIKDTFSETIDYSVVKSLSDLMSEKGWKYIVRSRDRNEVATVFVKSDEVDKLSEMFVIAISGEEIVFVQINGDLEDLIEIAVREHGLGIQVANKY
jgi:hypothetical protein